MSETAHALRTLSIDIGGSGVKALTLDENGTPLTDRVRRPTPGTPTPDAVLAEIDMLIAGVGEFERVSCGFPGVVVDGQVRTAVNLHPDWVGFDLAGALTQHTGKPARVVNDADMQGLGCIEGRGVELVLTLGTGMGSALFVDGQLVPNLELPHHPFRKRRTYEECVGAAALDRMGRKKWNRRVRQAIGTLARVFNYRLLYIGGGNAKLLDPDLPDNVRVVPNISGLLGGIALWR